MGRPKLPLALLAALAVLVLIGVPSMLSCKKKGVVEKDEVVAQAKAEHNCDDVSIESQEGRYFKLSVCGKTRWYRCTKKS